MDRTAYLVPAIEVPDDVQRLLEAVAVGIFEEELWAWHTDEADWPKKRDLQTFLEWFDVEVNSMVMDLCDYELEEDEPVE